MKRGHDIVTNFDYPPIPDRSMDWSAHLRDYDGAPDASGPNTFIGRGPTETAAVADLLERLDEYDATNYSQGRKA
jgi:hypothetical protein